MNPAAVWKEKLRRSPYEPKQRCMYFCNFSIKYLLLWCATLMGSNAGRGGTLDTPPSHHWSVQRCHFTSNFPHFKFWSFKRKSWADLRTGQWAELETKGTAAVSSSKHFCKVFAHLVPQRRKDQSWLPRSRCDTCYGNGDVCQLQRRLMYKCRWPQGVSFHFSRDFTTATKVSGTQSETPSPTPISPSGAQIVLEVAIGIRNFGIPKLSEYWFGIRTDKC